MDKTGWLQTWQQVPVQRKIHPAGGAIVLLFIASLFIGCSQEPVTVVSFDNGPPQGPPFAEAAIYEKGFFQRSVEITGTPPLGTKRTFLFIKGEDTDWIVHNVLATGGSGEKVSLFVPPSISGWELKSPVIAAVLAIDMEQGSYQITKKLRMKALPINLRYSEIIIVKPFPPFGPLLARLFNWRKHLAAKIDVGLISGDRALNNHGLRLSRWRGGESLVSGRCVYTSVQVVILVKEIEGPWIVQDKVSPDSFTGEFEGWWHQGVKGGTFHIRAAAGHQTDRYRKGQKLAELSTTLWMSRTIIVQRD